MENWEKKSKESTKKYTSYLKRVDKKTILKQLPEAHE